MGPERYESRIKDRQLNDCNTQPIVIIHKNSHRCLNSHNTELPQSEQDITQM